MDIDLDHLKTWIDRSETRSDLVSPTPLQGFSALLDREEKEPADGSPLPPGAHWLFTFLPVHRQSSLGVDGHPKRGGFLPPVPLPRRMWAGSRMQFLAPLRVGDTLERRSSIIDVNGKHGRSGTLVFVKVRHDIGNGHSPAVIEEQDIVYRDDVRSGTSARISQSAPVDHNFARTVTPDPTLLFRYSALTHNAHRIHYDQPYATRVEGYPGLVVHGPLIATLLLDLAYRQWPEASIETFTFRAVKPLFDNAPFEVCGRFGVNGRTLHLWAKDTDGTLAMDATATLRA